MIADVVSYMLLCWWREGVVFVGLVSLTSSPYPSPYPSPYSFSFSFSLSFLSFIDNILLSALSILYSSIVFRSHFLNTSTLLLSALSSNVLIFQ